MPRRARPFRMRGDPFVTCCATGGEGRKGSRGFMRVHRNALVRLDAVKEMTAEDELVLSTGRLAISRRRMEEVRRVLGL